jgi:hypothetical protein
MGLKVVDSIYLTKDRDWYRAVLGMIMKYEIHKIWGTSLLPGEILILAAEEILCPSATVTSKVFP